MINDNHILNTILLLLLICSTLPTHAEIYRWTDKNGKVHYGDQKPAGKADEISTQVKQQNIDTSHAEHKKLEALFRKENDADRDYQRQQEQPSSDAVIRCKYAKDYLERISGRVQFIDKNGKAVTVTETERKQRVEETQHYIRENCTD